MNYREALEHRAEEQTYVIRIRHSDHEKPLRELRNQDMLKIHEYVFDDTLPGIYDFTRGALFDVKMAQKVIQDFIDGKDSCSALLIHCARGQSRSPAVGIALDEIFNLGNDPEKLKTMHPRYNQHIYSLMKRIAKSRFKLE